MFGVHVVMLALQKPGLKNAFSILRPNTGWLVGVCGLCLCMRVSE